MLDFAAFLSGVVITAVILGGGYLIWLLIGFLRLKRDPQQHELAMLLAEEATSEIAYGNLDASGTVTLYVHAQPWSDREQAKRLLHAAALLATGPSDLHRQADALAPHHS
jgi:hypothetical protein